MTRTEELMKLAEAATGDYVPVAGVSLEMLAFQWKATPGTIKQMVALCRLQHEALKVAADKVYSEQNDDEIGQAIAAFNKFEGGE